MISLWSPICSHLPISGQLLHFFLTLVIILASRLINSLRQLFVWLSRVPLVFKRPVILNRITVLDVELLYPSLILFPKLWNIRRLSLALIYPTHCKPPSLRKKEQVLHFADEPHSLRQCHRRGLVLCYRVNAYQAKTYHVLGTATAWL